MKRNKLSTKLYNQLKTLKNSNSICLISHINPDTDAIASMEVMRDFLQQHFKIKTVDIFAESSKDSNHHAEILESTSLNPEAKIYDTAIMMDSPNTTRLGSYEYLFKQAKLKIIIDHHTTNEFQADINIVELRSSTCEIIYSIAEYFKFKLSQKNLGKLYAGIITDTNNFSVGNFNSNTFRIVSKFIDKIDKEKIHHHFLQNSNLKNFQLLSQAINNITSLNNGKILISHVSSDEASMLNATYEDFTGIINKLATISKSLLICFIYPINKEYYVSLRAKSGLSIADIAKSHFGGGHDGAAAYISNENIEEIERTIIKEFKEKLIKFNQDSNFEF